MSVTRMAWHRLDGGDGRDFPYDQIRSTKLTFLAVFKRMLNGTKLFL